MYELCSNVFGTQQCVRSFTHLKAPMTETKSEAIIKFIIQGSHIMLFYVVSYDPSWSLQPCWWLCGAALYRSTLLEQNENVRIPLGGSPSVSCQDASLKTNNVSQRNAQVSKMLPWKTNAEAKLNRITSGLCCISWRQAIGIIDCANWLLVVPSLQRRPLIYWWSGMLRRNTKRKKKVMADMKKEDTWKHTLYKYVNKHTLLI